MGIYVRCCCSNINWTIGCRILFVLLHSVSWNIPSALKDRKYPLMYDAACRFCTSLFVNVTQLYWALILLMLIERAKHSLITMCSWFAEMINWLSVVASVTKGRNLSKCLWSCFRNKFVPYRPEANMYHICQQTECSI